MMVDQDNGISVGMVKGRTWKVWRFSINEFWRDIDCLVLDTTFGLGGLRICDMEEIQEIILNKRNICYIRVKFNFYKVCVYSILFIVFFIIILLY